MTLLAITKAVLWYVSTVIFFLCILTILYAVVRLSEDFCKKKTKQFFDWLDDTRGELRKPKEPKQL